MKNVSILKYFPPTDCLMEPQEFQSIIVFILKVCIDDAFGMEVDVILRI